RDAPQDEVRRKYRRCKTHFQLAPIDSTAACAIARSVAQSPPLTPTPPMHSPFTRIGTPPSMAVQRSGPAASANPSACVTSRSWPTAPFAVVARLLEAAHTAFVVQECSVWNLPPSIRSSTTTWPPASTMQQDTAILASRAFSSATAIIFFAPSWVRRLVSAKYIVPP